MDAPKELLALGTVRQALDAIREAATDESVSGTSAQAARQAKVAAALVLLEEAFDGFGNAHVPSGEAAAAGSADDGGVPDYGYGHPAHRPDPNATYVFDPGPYRLLPVRRDRRWRTPG